MKAVLRSLWLMSRPKTLSASVVPVLVASALVGAEGRHFALWISLCCLASAMFIQIGTNFVNDALDFVKGADRETRLGDARAAQQGWFTPRQVMAMGLFRFFAALLLGIPLVMKGGWPILGIGVVSLFLGYAYTGGPFPLAYLGLGDLFVILFFGLVAVGGVYFLHTGLLTAGAVIAGLQIGFLATVLIAVNNLRDLDQDRLAGKRTLSVRLGPRLGRIEVLALFAAAFGLNIFWLLHGHVWACVLPLIALPLAFKISLTLLRTQPSRAYNRLLAQASFVHMLFGVLLSVGLFLQ